MNENKASNKYLILLSGSPRGGEKAWESLIKFVKEPLSADLAISYGDNFKIPNILKENITYDWKFTEPENWIDYFAKEYKGTWKEFLLLGKDLGMAGGLDNNSGSGAIVSALKDIIYKNYLEIVVKYEYIIHTRFDQLYVDFQDDFSGDYIWIPEGEDYFGICDRFAVFPSKYAKEYFSICQYIDSPESLSNAPENVSPESVLIENLKFNKLEDKIIRFKRNHLTVALDSDGTRWRQAKYKIYFFGKTMMKYPDEFIDSISNIKEKYGFIRLVLTRPVLTFNYLYLLLRRLLGKLKSAIL